MPEEAGRGKLRENVKDLNRPRLVREKDIPLDHSNMANIWLNLGMVVPPDAFRSSKAHNLSS